MGEIIETKLGTVEYTRKGTGQAIIFLHGGHSNCYETLFHEGYDQTKYQLITPSRPGYGKTSLNGNSQPDAAARLLYAMAEKLNLNNIIVVGISAGGLTAIELTNQLGDKVQKLILVSAVTKKWLNPSADLYKKGKKMFAPNIEKFSWAMFRFFFRLIPRKMSKILFEEISGKPNYKISESEIKAIRDMTFKQSSGKGFVADLDQDIDANIMKEINCPTLILHSKNDRSVNIEMAEHAHREIPNSELIIFDNNWGHLLWLGADKQEAIKALNKFLEANTIL